MVAMLISFAFFRFSIATKRYGVSFKPIPERKQIFDAHLLNVVLLACLAMYLFNNNGQEGIFLVIGGILTAFLLTFEFGKVPVLLGAKTGNLRLDSVEEIVIEKSN